MEESGVTNEAGYPSSLIKLEPRKYQLELLEKAKNENVIVFLETGSGKTLIAMLLIDWHAKRIEKPSKKVCIFLAPTVPLVEQQAEVIRSQLNLKVGRYHSRANSSHKTHEQWEEELEKQMVLVMTADILLHKLHHCFIKMEWIELLIFDECHHAHKRHSYAQILKEFYKKDIASCPRIFGMTASPIMGKFRSNQLEYAKGINSLEQLLDATVYTVNDRSELEMFVVPPERQIHYFENKHLLADHITPIQEKLEECYSKLFRLTYEDHKEKETIYNLQDLDESKISRKIGKILGSLIYCLHEAGIWGANLAAKLYLVDNCGYVNKDRDYSDNTVIQSFLHDAILVFESLFPDNNGKELKEPFYSSRILSLLDILSSYSSWPLSKDLNPREAAYYCQFLNLLVATDVGEEGLDIQTCSLVIRFDLPTSVRSYIQSRGRARRIESKYIFLLEWGNIQQQRLIDNLILGEMQMRKEVEGRSSAMEEAGEDSGDEIYKVDETDATISTCCSVSLVYQYCSKLPRDGYSFMLPNYSFLLESGGVRCQVILPPTAPITLVAGPLCSSQEKAKRAAFLETCKKLHSIGALTNYLLPHRNDTEYDNCDTVSANSMEGDVELQEMAIPIAFQGSWMKCDKPVSLKAYLLKFIPIPPDREYTYFALFLDSSLPKDIETLRIELHLSHSRIVMTEILPSGNMKFNSIQLRKAIQFQEVFLKVFLEREAFHKAHVWLTKETDLFDGSSASYLLLPVEIGSSEDMFDINWMLIENCMSSPVFYPEGSSTENDKNVIHPRGTLKLLNGWFDADEIQDSLVVTPHNNNSFFYIVSILSEMNSHSMLDERGCSYAEHYKTKYGIVLEHPQQPLLQAKGAFVLRNLLHPRQDKSESKQYRGNHNEEFVELPPELCCVKLTAFSSNLARSISLLPSLMHRLESLLHAAELKEMLTNAFPEGGEVSIMTILQAITTEKCSEGFSLERLEILGDAFLKYAVSSYLFLKNSKANEGQLSSERTRMLNNISLYEKGKAKGFQAHIQDECFDPKLFFTLGRPCRTLCTSDTMYEIHCSGGKKAEPNYNAKCNRRHRWLNKKTIADVVEALIGAYLVDSGWRAALAFLNWIGLEIEISSHLVHEACIPYKDISHVDTCISIDSLQSLTGHEFMHKGLLLEAFTHASYDAVNSYQRLEYLGDAVLDYIITSYFYSMYPKISPGYLTDMKAMIVNNEALAAVSVHHNLYSYIIHKSEWLLSCVTKYADSSKAMKQDDLKARCPKVLGDIVESLAGAILLDSRFDLERVWNIMVELIEPMVSMKTLQLQPDRELSELVDYHHLELKYSGDKIQTEYHAKATVSGKGVHVEGTSVKLNKKFARKIAARDALIKLQKHNIVHRNKIVKEVRQPKLIGFNKQDSLELADEVPSPESAPCTVSSERESGITSVDEASSCDKTLDSQSSALIVDTSSTLEIPEDNTTEINVQSLSSSSVENVDTSSTSEIPEDNTTEINVQSPSSSSVENVKAQDDDNTQNKAQEDDNTQNNPPHDLLVYSKDLDTVQYVEPARSYLNYFCQKHGCEPPSWECIREEGLPHCKSFTYKVVLKIPQSTVESEGKPSRTKKLAMESAAEPLRWWLCNQGF